MIDPVDEQVAHLIQEYARQTSGIFHRPYKPRDYAAGRQIMELEPTSAARATIQLLNHLVAPSSPVLTTFEAKSSAKSLLSAMLRKPLPICLDEFAETLSKFSGDQFWEAWCRLPMRGILRAWAKRIEQRGLTPKSRQALNHLRVSLRQFSRGYAAPRLCAEAIDQMVGEGAPPKSLLLATGEAWSDQAMADLSAMPGDQQEKWARLLDYARIAKGARPTKKWMSGASPLLDAIGRDVFTQVATIWFNAFPGLRTDRLPPLEGYHADPNLMIADMNAAILKGLAWCCSCIEDVSLSRVLSDAAAAGFKKVPCFGPRCRKVADAALYALTMMPGDEPIAQLGRLAMQVKQPTGLKNVHKALGLVAARTGQTVEDLAEKTVPTFDLDAAGFFRQSFGAFTGALSVDWMGQVSLGWQGSDGKPRKTIPQAVVRDHPAALKELKRKSRDIQTMLAAQRQRLESLMRSERSWTLDDWRERYLDHPLLGIFSKRLIWQLQSEDQTTAVTIMDGKFVTSQDCIVQPSASAHIRLWHPIGCEIDEVLAWRSFLDRHRMVQPFKQAHREIYLLTDAERATSVYSNRFAGHILRQHQFVALCQQRGWNTGLQGMWDGGDLTPTLVLPEWNLQAQFWTEIIEANEMDDLTGTGVSLHLTTDQVRFRRADDLGVVALDQLDPLVFSEVMRDVDLFVGVTSVGNDPAWYDGGADGCYHDYWHQVSFGDLSATAQTRRIVLETLLPRLKIRDRAQLLDRFLLIRGRLRTYKIHLGSANILMLPNDQYLCIVPSRGTASSRSPELFLPFEGDQTLAVILSKAFILAADDQITDSTITQQILSI